MFLPNLGPNLDKLRALKQTSELIALLYQYKIRNTEYTIKTYKYLRVYGVVLENIAQPDIAVLPPLKEMYITEVKIILQQSAHIALSGALSNLK